MMFKEGGGDTFGGIMVVVFGLSMFLKRTIDEVDGMKDVEVSFVDGVLVGALGALGDEY